MPKAPWSGSRRSERLPPNWRTEIRPAVFALYSDTCHVCELPGANEIDHLVPGDNHALENLRPIHGRGSGFSCHQRKSSAEGGHAAQAKRPKRQRDPEPHPGLRPKR